MKPRKQKVERIAALFFIALALSAAGAPPPPEDLAPTPIPNQSPTPYAAWTNGFSNQTDYFPIGVWLQNPSRALEYKVAGFNLYIGLWQGPTEAQLSALTVAEMPVICAQNDYARDHPDNPIIVGWLQKDEPDNAQKFADFWQSDTNLIAEAWPEYADRTAESWGTWGPPASPAQVTNWYHEMKSYDDSRPVLLNLGQGVAWDGWHGRGVRTGHTEDFPEYAQGGDIVSFDIYPVVHSDPKIAGALWRVPYGVKRLRAWDGEKPTWAAIECTHISNPPAKATPAQIRSEVWMAIIFGARGVIYFVHQFEPTFIEAALLSDPETLAAVTAINTQIQSLSSVLNRPSVTGKVEADSSNPATPIRTMVKHHGGFIYIFSAALHDEATTATFNVSDIESHATVEVLGEARTLFATNGLFSDAFSTNDVHIYKALLKKPGSAVILQ